MNEIKNIRTGVVGVGSMGQNHARIYSEISNLVGVADPNEEQGKLVAERFGVKWYKDYRELEGLIDAVTIAVPTSYHYPVAKHFIKNGTHVLVEKPLAGNIDEAIKIVDLAKESNIILAVGHIERHNGVIRKLKNMLDDSLLGDIITLSARRFSPYPSRITDVGVLFDLTIHDVDIICHLIQSPVISVYATGVKSRNNNFEDHINFIMKFANGSIGMCETSWLTPNKVRELSLVSTKCYGKLDYLKQEIELSSSVHGDLDFSNLYQQDSEHLNNKIIIKGEEPLLSEIRDFLDSIKDENSPLTTGLDGLNAVKIVSAGADSLRTKKSINLK